MPQNLCSTVDRVRGGAINLASYNSIKSRTVPFFYVRKSDMNAASFFVLTKPRSFSPPHSLSFRPKVVIRNSKCAISVSRPGLQRRRGY